jgi:kumamolisin
MRVTLAAGIAFAFTASPRAEPGLRPLVVMTGSIKAVPAEASLNPDQARVRPMVVRSALSDAELSETMQFEMALKMRNFGELQERIGRGEVISRAEMAEKYFPLESDYDATAAWIESLGLTVTHRYDNHLSLFAQGTVAQIRDALKVDFARVAFLGREYTSAISAPSMPPELVSALVGIDGLQPHLRLRPHHTSLRPLTTAGNTAPYVPANLAVAYGATGLSVTGAGETIGLIGYAFPATSDLTLFWQNCGIPQSPGAITEVTVGAGPPASPDSGDLEEITLDAEWSSSLAPGAAVRIYGTSDSDQFGDMAFQQVIGDLPSQPQMRQLSVSYGNNEDQYPPGQIQTDSQYLATIAGSGVTIFFSSGDGGSRPDPSTGGYNSADPLNVDYPASDPSVTGVGGTSLVATNPYGSSPDYSETAWFSNGGASGGGPSGQFNRPVWQTGEGLSNETQRLVPDVASSADPSNGAYMIFNGEEDTVGGTSWGAPTWAGFCALFNQARTAAGLGPIGLINVRIYPLVGGPCFQDITSGSNGDYYATPGYDECTGLGTPNVGLLIQALSVSSPLTLAPIISVQPANQTVTSGQNATFSVTVASFSAATYQWQLLAEGTGTWVNLANNAPYSGAETGSLLVTGVSAALGGDQYRCRITNAAGSVTTSPASLNIPAVQPLTVFDPGAFSEIAEGTSTTIGGYEQYPYNVVGPVTFQWYHDGKPVAGATSAYFPITSVAYSDAGDYVLAATNPGGTVAANLETVVVTNPTSANAWMDAQQQGTIVYFLYANPAQILRYDLNAGTWLAPVALSMMPTAFRTATEGVYVAFGRTVSLYSPDLSTVTPLLNTEYPTVSIFVNGSYAYLVGSNNGGSSGVFTTLSRNGGAIVGTPNGNLANSSFKQEGVSSALGAAYGEQFGMGMISITLNSDGTLGESGGINEAGRSVPWGTTAYVFPGGLLVADNGGTVFNGSDLSPVGSLGPAFDDLCFLADGSPVAVRGNAVSLYNTGTFGEVGRVALAGGAQRIFANGSTVTGFSPPAAAGGAIGVEQVTESRLAASPRPSAEVVSPVSLAFVPDDSFVGADGQLYLLSKLYRSLFVWSPSTRSYVNTIPLQGVPYHITYSATLNRVYIAYDDTRITKIDLATSNAETPFAPSLSSLINFVAADSQLYVHTRDAQDSGEMQYLYDSGGSLVATQGWGYYAYEAYWDSPMQSIYDLSPIFIYQVERLPLSIGAFGTLVDSAPDYAQSSNGPAPFRFSGDGSLLVNGNGIIFNTTTLDQAGVLGDSLVDAAWLGTTVFTLNVSGSGSAVQQWGGANFLLTNTASLPGYPLRIWPIPGNQLLALTDASGFPTMTLVDAAGYAESPNAPQLTVQPRSQTSSAGSTVVFTAAATGSAAYQWQFNGVNLADGAGVSGSTGPQLVLSGVSPANAGNYTCAVTNSSGSNFSDPANLVVESSNSPGYLINISARSYVGTGSDIMIGGFYIVGSTSRTVLIQALGPALAGEGVSGVLQEPALTIHDSTGATIYSNTGWGSSQLLLNAAAAAYANPVLKPGSGDSEVLLTLPPGGYTAEVSGADGGTGVALVAIYQLP